MYVAHFCQTSARVELQLIRSHCHDMIATKGKTTKVSSYSDNLNDCLFLCVFFFLVILVCLCSFLDRLPSQFIMFICLIFALCLTQVYFIYTNATIRLRQKTQNHQQLAAVDQAANTLVGGWLLGQCASLA